MENNISYEQVNWRDLSDEQTDEILQPLSLIEKLKVLKTYSPLQYRYTGYLYNKYQAELMRCYMNARVTYGQAIGNKKSDRNRCYAETYKEAMIELKIPIPADEICWVLGVFNGVGSN